MLACGAFMLEVGHAQGLLISMHAASNVVAHRLAFELACLLGKQV